MSDNASGKILNRIQILVPLNFQSWPIGVFIFFIFKYQFIHASHNFLTAEAMDIKIHIE